LLTVPRVNIAIASPSDVSDERNAILEIFVRWNDANGHAFLHPVMWESSSVPALGDHPQHILNKQIIDKSDLLIAILWSKLGTPTPTAGSGTVEEIREFIKYKGAGRVMLYFCCRDLPYNSTDPGELARLHQFKEQMRPQGLFHEYTTCEEFEKELYRHLDTKIRDLLDGRLPLPSTRDETKEVPQPKPREHADPRLRELIDFGTTIEDIAKGFSARMDAFDQAGFAGPDKFLDLGAHVYLSCAKCLDHFLTYSAASMAEQDRRILERISTRLKRVAASSTEYAQGSFVQFWKEGREASDELAAHAAYLKRMREC
jgi:hypothetical protein